MIMRMFHRQWPRFLALALCLALGAGCTKAARAKRLLASAERDFQTQRYDAAEVEYEAVLRLSPLNPVSIRQLGLIYFEEGQMPKAYAYLVKSHEQDAKNPGVQLKLAQIYLGAGKAAEAADLAQTYLQTDPTNEHALLVLVDSARSSAALATVRSQIEEWAHGGKDAAAYHAALGWIDLRQQKTADAEIELQTALRLDPKLSTAHLGMASVYFARKDTNNLAQALKTAADLSPPRSSTRLKYVEYKLQFGPADEAKQILEDITRQAPDYIPAWNHLMKIAYSERKYDDCAACVAKILARDPSNMDALLQSGNLALARHKVADAVSQFERLDANVNRKAPQVKYYLALAYLLNGETAKATASLRAALALERGYAPALLLLAELDVRAGDSPEAVTLLTQLIKSQPENVQAHLLLAQAYLALRQIDQALVVYVRMARSFPRNAQIPFLIGRVYESQGDIAHAREAYERSLVLQPGYLAALENITDLDLAAQRFDDADARVTEEIKRTPKAAEPWLLQGRIRWAQGQTNEAESAMSKAVGLNPDYPPAYLALAQFYLAAHEEEQALDRLNRLVAKTNDATALIEIGMIHQEQRQFEPARAAYEKALAVNPKLSAALNNLAYLYSEFLGNLDRAAQLAQSARDLQPFSPYTADTLGWILFKQGQYPRALTLLQESEEKQPNDPEVAMHLGMAYYMMEEEDLARLYLQRAVDSRTDFPAKEQARQCLAFLAIDPQKATPAMIDDLQKRVHENPHDPIPLTRLAAIQERQGELDKASQAYQSLIQQNPRDLQAIIKLARLSAGPLKDPRKALTLAKSAHDLAPNDPRAASLLGELVFQSGDYPWALSLLKEAANQLTNQPTVLYDLAWAYYAAGRAAEADANMEAAVAFSNALPTLEDARQFLALRAAVKDPAQARAAGAQAQSILQKQPRYLPALMVSALLDEQQGASKEAADIYTQVLNDYPLFTPALRQLAILYTRSGENDNKAYDLAEKARSAAPDDFELERALGILACRRGDATRSAQLLQGSAQKFPDDAELLYYLGLDFYKLKQPKECKQTLQRALALNLPDKLAGEARRILAQLK